MNINKTQQNNCANVRQIYLLFSKQRAKHFFDTWAMEKHERLLRVRSLCLVRVVFNSVRRTQINGFYLFHWSDVWNASHFISVKRTQINCFYLFHWSDNCLFVALNKANLQKIRALSRCVLIHRLALWTVFVCKPAWPSGKALGW